MFFGGLPGGSPGPNATCTFGALVGVIVFAVLAAAVMLWFMLYVVNQMELPLSWSAPNACRTDPSRERQRAIRHDSAVTPTARICPPPTAQNHPQERNTNQPPIQLCFHPTVSNTPNAHAVPKHALTARSAVWQ